MRQIIATWWITVQNAHLIHPTTKLLATLADHEHKSASSLVKELVLEALEHREDIMLSAIAEIRDKINAKIVKHDDTWK